MKKLIAWLSKGSKITKILKYIYQALVVAKNLVSGSESGINEANISADKVTEKISVTQKYLELAVKYLSIVLYWLGVSFEEREALARSIVDESDLNSELNSLELKISDTLKDL